MIGYLHGKVLSKNLDNSTAILLCGHVGYEVMVPKMLSDTMVLEQTLSLWVHTHVREDILSLYGFTSENERNFFKILLGLNGLGPKHALSLISEHGASGLVALIIRQDADAISSAPGIGKKLAQRVILDLQTKVQKLAWFEKLPVHTKTATRANLSPQEQRKDDLSSALQNLGFAPITVRAVLDKLEDSGDWMEQPFETSLRMALKELSRHSISQPSGAANA